MSDFAIMMEHFTIHRNRVRVLYMRLLAVNATVYCAGCCASFLRFAQSSPAFFISYPCAER
jgi:predicted metal-binding membrane protein